MFDISLQKGYDARDTIRKESVMNLKRLISFAAAVCLSTTALADPFYGHNAAQKWYVFGHTTESELNASCVARTTWLDGSVFSLIQDLVDGEMYIVFTNNQWQIAEEPGTTGQIRVNFHGARNEIVGSGTMQFQLLNKNTIRIREIYQQKFLPDFAAAHRMIFVMPGTVSNAGVPLEGTRMAIESLFQCISASKKVPNLNERPKTKGKDTVL